MDALLLSEEVDVLRTSLCMPELFSRSENESSAWRSFILMLWRELCRLICFTPLIAWYLARIDPKSFYNSVIKPSSVVSSARVANESKCLSRLLLFLSCDFPPYD